MIFSTKKCLPIGKYEFQKFSNWQILELRTFVSGTYISMNGPCTTHICRCKLVEAAHVSAGPCHSSAAVCFLSCDTVQYFWYVFWYFYASHFIYVYQASKTFFWTSKRIQITNVLLEENSFVTQRWTVSVVFGGEKSDDTE